MTALEKSLPGLTSKTTFINAPCIEISGRVIRKLAAAKLDYQYYVPTAVYDLIRQHTLYSG